MALADITLPSGADFTCDRRWQTIFIRDPAWQRIRRSVGNLRMDVPLRQRAANGLG